MDTMSALKIDEEGKLHVVDYSPGDGLVLRRSALLDERAEQELGVRLVSPISWSYVLFVFSDHLGITKDPAFIDNLLYFLLESPRMESSAPVGEINDPGATSQGPTAGQGGWVAPFQLAGLATPNDST